MPSPVPRVKYQNREHWQDITGTLSRTSKMPGWSWGLSAKHCQVGSTLRPITGSVCSKCYALKGRYMFSTTQAALARRMQHINHPEWVAAMAHLIGWNVSARNNWFRWFDTGDLQSATMLIRIARVCSELPDIHFWLPTREAERVAIAQRTYFIPQNLVIRVSDPMIEPLPVTGAVRMRRFANTSSVLSKAHKPSWPALVETNSPEQHHCPAPLQNNACGDCRACWNTAVKHVVYLEH